MNPEIVPVPLPGFDAPPPPPEPGERISAGRKVTMRQRDRLAAGLHPLEGWALGPADHRCGDCAHLKAYQQSKGWYKCDLRITHSTVTDVRLRWPACTYWIDPASMAPGAPPRLTVVPRRGA